MNDLDELIAEARERADRDWRFMNTEGAGLLRRLADALEAATRVPVQGEPRDVRELLHAECDCVPDLGPAHCHLCSKENGSPVPWPECAAVAEVAARALEEAAELVEVTPEDTHPSDVFSVERICEKRAEDWLRARAAEYRKAVQS